MNNLWYVLRIITYSTLYICSDEIGKQRSAGFLTCRLF
jgi:hypothetical protein